jgi:hypothetical protein
MCAPADLVAAPAAKRGARGFTLLEVLLALGLLLVGGVSILSVFTLAVVHKVERRMETKLDLLRPEARTLAQQAIDKAAPGRPPEALKDVSMSEPGFSVTITFTPSQNEDPAQVAHARIAYRGKDLQRGRLPPMWLYRSTLDPK